MEKSWLVYVGIVGGRSFLGFFLVFVIFFGCVCVFYCFLLASVFFGKRKCVVFGF